MMIARIRQAVIMLLNWRSLVSGLTGIVLGCLLGFYLILWGSREPPVIVHSMYELDGVVARNGHIDIAYDVDRLRVCPAETSRWLWTWVDQGGQRVKQFFPLTNTPTALTDKGVGQHFILSLPLPAGIWPGEWFYLSRTVEHCSLLPNSLRPYIHESPDVPIHIVDEG